MNKYVFGMNYNAYLKKYESYCTEIHIPATDESEAKLKLLSLVADNVDDIKLSLQDIRDY